MSDKDLTAFFAPQGITVIGASREPGKLGHDVIRNLLNHHYPGPIYPVNPNAADVMGLTTYPAISDVPDPVDLAVIVLPARFVAQALDACGIRGIKNVIVVSGGFRELGTEGAREEARLQQIALCHDIALMGPNCIGTIDTYTPLNTTFVTGYPAPGEIALISQSGALAASIIDWAQKAHFGFSKLVSLGNMAGVTETDMLETTAKDGRTRVIALYMEGVSSGEQFLESASQISQQLPIIALKVGRGKGAAKAVSSHTGALAGAETAYDAAFQRAGVLRVETLEMMMDWAQALAWQPLPAGNRVAILTNGGGPGIMAADALERAGMQLAPLTEGTKSWLRERVPPAASVDNPVDILAGSGPATYALCLDALLRDETVDAVVVITAPQDWFAPVSLAEIVANLANSPLGRNKPVLTTIMGPDTHSDTAKLLRQKHIPNYPFPERVGSVLGAMWQRRQWLDAIKTTDAPSEIEGIDYTAAEVAIAAGMQTMDQSHWMGPDEVQSLLEAYRIPTPQTVLTTTPDEALEAAGAIGYPVALKTIIQGISHKTDIGGVLLNIDSPQKLKTAFDSLTAKAPALDNALLEGVLIQQMIQAQVELIVGVTRDPQFGPLVMVGAGGTQVELNKDVAFDLAPLTHLQVNSLLDRTAAGKQLAGYRGRAPVDKGAVIDIVQRIAQIALDWSQIEEIEINPLMCLPGKEGAYAVDVRVRLK